MENNENGSSPNGSLLDDAEAIGVIVHVAALLTTFIGPLIVLVISDDPFVQENVRNALNWEIMVVIYSFISVLLAFFMIGLFMLAAVAILNVIFCSIAAYKASQGEAWSYPLTYDFL